jgi:hypothetical protein
MTAPCCPPRRRRLPWGCSVPGDGDADAAAPARVVARGRSRFRRSQAPQPEHPQQHRHCPRSHPPKQFRSEAAAASHALILTAIHLVLYEFVLPDFRRHPRKGRERENASQVPQKRLRSRVAPRRGSGNNARPVPVRRQPESRYGEPDSLADTTSLAPTAETSRSSTSERRVRSPARNSDN